MSVDILQEKVRKTKSPVILDLSVDLQQIPESVRQEKTAAKAYYDFCAALLEGFKDHIPGVRFDFNQCGLLGALNELTELLELAKKLGFYVFLDAPSVLNPLQAERAAKLLDADSAYQCNALITNPYIGSDAMKPFIPYCKEGKTVFFAVRSANKSAAELQDMMTGARLVHVAAADHVKRLGEVSIGKCGYSQMGVLTAATNANAVMGLRNKFNRMFLLVDGLDYPGGNGKNCSYGFDRFGHGCAICVGASITAAWTAEGCREEDYVQLAVQAAERIRSNMSRYVTIL